MDWIYHLTRVGSVPNDGAIFLHEKGQPLEDAHCVKGLLYGCGEEQGRLGSLMRAWETATIPLFQDELERLRKDEALEPWIAALNKNTKGLQHRLWAVHIGDRRVTRDVLPVEPEEKPRIQFTICQGYNPVDMARELESLINDHGWRMISPLQIDGTYMGVLLQRP